MGGLLLTGGLSLTDAAFSQSLFESEGKKVDLGDISAKFARNMRVLARMLPDTETQKMMEVVAAKSSDLATFYRSSGGGIRRRKLLDEEEALKSKPNISKTDQKRIEDLQAEVKKADPDNLFQKGRKDIGESIKELQGMLSVLYTADQDVKDVIRITQQHLNYYNTALSKYQ